MKKYIIIAGVNGAGKSTLYKTKKDFLDMPRVNTEEVEFRRIAIYKNGESIRVSGKVPEWYKGNFEK